MSFSLSTRDELESCKQELLKKRCYMKHFPCSHAYTGSITTLLHIYHLVSVQQSKFEKSLVLHELTIQLTKKSEIELYNILNEYIDQLMIRKSMITKKDLCIRQIDPYYELLLKLCYGEKLIKQKKYEQYNEFMGTNETFFKSMITEMKTRPDYEKMSKTCIFLLHLINSDTSWHQPGGFLFQEERTCLLSDLLSMLPQGLFYKVFEVFLEKVEMMNLSVNCLEKSEIDSKYLHSVKTDAYINLLFKLFWCRKLIKEGHADGNIVYRCLNNLYRGKGPKHIVEFTAQIFSVTDNLPENSFLKVLLLPFLRKNLKTVTSMAILTPGYDRSGQIVNLNSTADKNKQGLIYTQCASILSGNKMKNVDIKQYARKLNIKGPEDENAVEAVSGQVKLLVLCILLLLVTALGNKSAKLKKYLALKYEYEMASLYLLWCSGDIEVHPGPTWRTKQLEHYSEQKRKWLQDINSILLKLYWEIPTHSKPKNLWQKVKRPKQWPTDIPFYDTKNAPKDDEGNKITDDEILTCLLECLKKKNVVIPQIYQSEISAWRNKNIQLLHKLQVFRIEMENVKSATLNLYLSNLGDDDEKNLQGIRVNIKKSSLDPKKMEDLLKNDKRQKKSAELVAYITRDLASTLCKLARGKDPMKKCDGIWNSQPDQRPKHWPEDVPFFNPCKRGSYEKKDKCSDRKLVDTFLNLQDLKIPQNFQVLVDTYQMMCNSTDNEEKKKNQEKLCRLYTVKSNVEKLDFAIQHLYEESLFLREVCDILNQFWTTQSVNEDAEDVLKNATVSSYERPHITVTIATYFKPDVDLSNISYTIPIKDAYLQIRCTTVLPNEPRQQQPLTGSFTTAKNPENFEDSVLPLYIIDFQSYYDFGNQTNFQNNNSDSAMDEDNEHKTSDLERKGKPLSVTHQYQRSHNDLESLTTHNTLSSDLDCTRCYTEYNTNLQVCESVNSSIGSPGENIDSSISTSKVKRKQLEDKEEPVKKLMKTKANQLGHYNSTDEEISSPESKNDGGSQEPNHISTSNQHDICSANVQDLPSLEFSLSDIIDGIGDNCNSKSSEESESFPQICDLESVNNSNQQDSHENINELNYIDNQMDQTDDKTELEKCLEMIKYLSR